MAPGTTPIPIAGCVTLHDYDRDTCPGCNWERYLEVRLRTGSAKAAEFAHPQEIVEEEYGDDPEVA